jgi:uncharacterized protein YndB with AHSA1/START domain
MTLRLEVRRKILATQARVFAAWTDPAQLQRWWGPVGVTCSLAEVDLRPGGRYRLVNELADGGTIVIVGEFLEVVAPERLVYSWRMEGDDGPVERVTVRFEPCGDATEIVVVHERIRDLATQRGHEAGWHGCLDGLEAHVAAPDQPP